MKVTELRIGNIIHWGDHFTTVDINMLRDIDVYNQGGLSGEPITEQWLLNFGFRKNNFEFVKDGWFLGLYFDEVHKDWHIYEARDSFHIRTIKHVHQLQNLYHAITDEELKYQTKNKHHG